MSSALHVGNLPFDVSSSELRAWFEQCGEVKEIRILEPGEAGRPRGFATVIMHHERAATLAIQRLDGAILEGRALSVTRLEGRPLTPSSAPRKDRRSTSAGARAASAITERPGHAVARERPLARESAGDAAAGDRSLVRVLQQFRERANMTYELDCSGTPLVVRVFFPVDGSSAAGWRLEAYTLPNSPVSTATASSRALALESIARSWHDEDAGRAPSKVDWDGVARAMASVRAI